MINLILMLNANNSFSLYFQKYISVSSVSICPFSKVKDQHSYFCTIQLYERGVLRRLAKQF